MMITEYFILYCVLRKKRCKGGSISIRGDAFFYREGAKARRFLPHRHIGNIVISHSFSMCLSYVLYVPMWFNDLRCYKQGAPMGL